MKLAVVIVNYNVKYFLKQCLASVFNSQIFTSDFQLELDVWVVDNDSVDGSVDMVRHDFPQVHIIENHENVGFARANNQALNLIPPTSDLILLLNPDTVVEHDTFVKCADFFRLHTDCGGLCVKMVDGEGQYLQESKRGFPSPEASFYKITGLIRLFPHSRRFAAYYMGHLPEEEVNEIEIMPGAFLMFRSEVYRQIGGLDESYFMYGEDIDFSWRIRMAGWKNYYLPLTHIIHYKGESTKKGSMNYVFTFYNAMSIFVKKYFSGRNATLFNALLQAAIWMRALLSWFRRIASRLAVPTADFLAAFGGFFLLKQFWATFWADNIDYYPPEYTTLVIPLYIFILLSASWLCGGYDKPLRPLRIVRGMGIGLLLLLAFYSLLDEGQRYSRMLLLSGSLWTLASSLLIRLLLSSMDIKGYALHARKRGRTLIVGHNGEAERVRSLYSSLGVPLDNLLVQEVHEARRLQDIIRVEKVEEVVFCGADIDLQNIIRLMAGLKTTGVDFKIAPAEGDYVIGSDSILSKDDLFTDELVTITTDTCRRQKRLFDIALSSLFLLLSPILCWFQKSKKQFFQHSISVLIGRKSWVGYTGRSGIFSPSDLAPNASQQTHNRLMLRYMRHYKTATDTAILLRNWRNLGKTLCILLFIILHSSFITSTASAQRIHGFISSGLALSQIEGDELKGFRKWGYTGGVGAIAALDRHENWNISLEAAYSKRGAYNASGDPYSVDIPLSYIDIPLLVHYRDPWGGILVGAGLNYSRLVQQPHSVGLYNPLYFLPDTTDMSFLRNDLALLADVRFPVWRGLWFNLRWQYSIIAVKRDWLFTEYKNNGTTVLTWRNDCYNHSLAFRLIWLF